MSKTITVSDETYQNLEQLASLRGFESVEQLLEEDEQLNERRKELARRRELGRKMKELREKIYREHGVTPDSTQLLREDRER